MIFYFKDDFIMLKPDRITVLIINNINTIQSKN